MKARAGKRPDQLDADAAEAEGCGPRPTRWMQSLMPRGRSTTRGLRLDAIDARNLADQLAVIAGT
jgi:hypothetical protein